MTRRRRLVHCPTPVRAFAAQTIFVWNATYENTTDVGDALMDFAVGSTRFNEDLQAGGHDTIPRTSVFLRFFLIEQHSTTSWLCMRIGPTTRPCAMPSKSTLPLCLRVCLDLGTSRPPLRCACIVQARLNSAPVFVQHGLHLGAPPQTPMPEFLMQVPSHVAVDCLNLEFNCTTCLAAQGDCVWNGVCEASCINPSESCYTVTDGCPAGGVSLTSDAVCSSSPLMLLAASAGTLTTWLC